MSTTPYAKVDLMSHTPEPEIVIEHALLSCRNTGEDVLDAVAVKTWEERLDDIFKYKHFGILEHASASFRIENVSRSLTHQLVRHRIASYAQLSMRAVEVPKLRMITPSTIQHNECAKKIYFEAFEAARKAYDDLVEIGIPIEDARYIAPIGIETQIFITMNFRSWMHFLKLRTDPHAQREIREVAFNIHGLLKEIAPNVFSSRYERFWE